MDSDDDIRPLIDNEAGEQIEVLLELNTQVIDVDPEFEQIVYGYRRSRWRAVLVYILSTLCCGLPFLFFHWCPTWFLYATSERSCFQLADQVLVVETYQKKCKTYYIHKILHKNIADTSGSLNQGFQDELVSEKCPIESAEDLLTPMHLDDGTTLTVQHYRYFRHKKQNLVWDGARAQWSLLVGIERGATCGELQAMGSRPPTSERRARMLNIYGLNEIKVPVQSALTLVVLEVFNPFYVFQLFTIAVWLAEPYYYYCIAVVLMSAFGVATSVIQTKKNQESLRATVEAHDTVELWDGRTVDSRFLCPGDVILLPPRCTLQVDAALLSGAATLNESMLTGESVPVSKTPLPRASARFDMKEHSHSVLFCGTRVIQTQRTAAEQPVRALVLRTGYTTAKGQLVRSILYPAPADFKFDRDSYKFIGILAGIAAAGLAYTVALKAYRALTPGDIALKALDIITIVIPPALPAAMTVGRLYAVNRLKAARVSCLNTRAVNVSGSIDCFCFDKTGTLTEDGLDMWGVVPVDEAVWPRRLGGAVRDPARVNDLHHLKLGMASCHSLALIDGEMAGDPLDLKMFESTRWTLEKPQPAPGCQLVATTVLRPPTRANINVDDIHMPLELGVVAQHQFVSSLARSSVVVRMRGEDVLRVYCKGAPETIAQLCTPDTVPADLNEVLSSYAEKGYRVIAVGARVMETTLKELHSMTRDQVEKELEFVGLVILDNRLKPATAGIIRELREANVHVVMITGDNVHTAVSVARECGILGSGERAVRLVVERDGAQPTLYCHSERGMPLGRPVALPKSWSGVVSSGACSGADSGRGSWRGSGRADCEAPPLPPDYKIIVTGDAWRVLLEQYPCMVGPVVARGAVFARMAADQKQRLVLEYQALGYYVGMCGDGANDCGALRAAHTGVSLSEAESSVAAPFTSHHPDIVCVTRVLREGRAALSTSFGVFKFMIAYSLTEFLSVAFLYYFDSNLTDFQFLFIDVGLIVNFAFFFGLTEAYTGKLCKIPPLTSLLGFVPLLSLIGQMLLITLALFLSYYALTFFPWYERHTYEGKEANKCWENYAIFTVSMFQYIIMAIVFSHGAPYRRSVATNKQLMISMFIMLGICIYITVSPPEWLAEFLELKMPLNSLMSYIVLAIAAFNFVLALFFERIIIQYMMERKLIIPKFLKEKKVRKTPHLMLSRQFSNRDYLDCASDTKYDKETNGVSDSSSGVLT